MTSRAEQSQPWSKPLRARRLFAAAAVAAALSLPSLALNAQAATITWTGAADGNWFSAPNWSPAQIPSSADAVVIDSNATVSVSGATSISFATLALGDAAGNFSPTLRLSAAQSASGAVTIHRGAKLQQDTNQQIVFGALNVLPGGVLTHTANSSARSFLINLSVTGDFTLQTGAEISASGLGYNGGAGYQASGSGPGGGRGNDSSSGSGGGHGGMGGLGRNATLPGGAGYDSVTNPTDLGSGGGGAYPAALGGRGGGAVLMNVGGSLILNGLIAVDGADGDGAPHGSGGGAGGTVNLTANTISGTGVVRANGGNGAGTSGGQGGGGGGGGRIAIAVASNDSSSLSLAADTGAGGTSDGKTGGAGVIAYKGPSATNYSLDIGGLAVTPLGATPLTGVSPAFGAVAIANAIVGLDAGSTLTLGSFAASGAAAVTASNIVMGANAPFEIKNGGALSLAAQAVAGGALTVRGGGTFRQMNANALNFGSVLVEDGGLITHAANAASRTSILNLNVTGDFTVQAGATISASGLGYSGGTGYQVSGNGPGGGRGNDSSSGSGGGHGGMGGLGRNATFPGGAGYDSVTNPTDLGSGGGGAYFDVLGGRGGGAVLMNVGGRLILNGLIVVDGADGAGAPHGSGGGAGGTVNLTAPAISGTGFVRANGGNGAGTSGGQGGGGGGGGRIAITIASNDASSLRLAADTGAGGTSDGKTGGAGVIAYKGPSAATYDLSIGGVAVTALGATPLTASQNFGAVAITNAVVTGSTVTFSALAVSGAAAVTASNLVTGAAAPFEVRSGASLNFTVQSISGGALTVRGGGTFRQMNAAALNFGSVLVEAGGLITHAANSTARSFVVNLNVTGDFDLQAGATISASGLGYNGGAGYQASGSGPGGGPGNASSSGSGGGHGGTGGLGRNATLPAGAGYDSVANPTDLGSGGGGAYFDVLGGRGGGAVMVNVGGNLFLNGLIAADGADGGGAPHGSGGGAGGTVNLTGTTISGTGVVRAVGGVGGGLSTGQGGGGGAGGRVAVTGCSADTVSASILGGAGGLTGGASGGAGSFAPTVPPSCPSAPPAPTNLAVVSSGENASGQTVLSAAWSPAAQALFYTLQASTASNFSGIAASSTVPTETATLAGLAPSSTYYLRVSAANGYGTSAFSGVVSTLTPVDLTSPRAPRLLTAAGSAGGNISLAWTAATTGQQTAFFNLYRATEPFTSTAGLTPVLLRSTAAAYVDQPPSDGTYVYAVAGLDPSFNESGLSNALSALSLHAGPSAPQALAAAFSAARKAVSLSWTAPLSGTPVAYDVHRATFAFTTASAQTLLASATTTAYADFPPLVLDATYFYRVAAVDAVGNRGTPSAAAAAAFDVHAPLISIARVADGQNANHDLTPSLVITDFSSFMSTITLNGEPFVSSPVTYGTFNQTVGEGGTASLSCPTGTIQSFTSVYATSCGVPVNCGTCPIDGVSCSVRYNNAACGDQAPGCSKDGRLSIKCGVPGVTLTQPGAYLLSVQARDTFANASSATLTFTIDKASPTMVLVSPPDGLMTNQNVVVSYQAADDLTPAARLVVTDELGAVVPSSYTIAAEGARNLTLTARDLAGNSSSAAAFILDKTAPAAVADLRLASQNKALGQATVAWTAPHDTLSGLAGYVLKAATFPINGANFHAAATVAISTTPLPDGRTEQFVVSVATLSTVYFAQKSSDAAGNLSVISNMALWDLSHPQVAAIDIQDGAVVSRPRRITAVITDDIAVSSVIFSVDDIVQSTLSFPPYAFDWDMRKFPDGSHFLTVQATDATGNTVRTRRNVTVSYLPPAVPTINSPANGFTTNVATISISGLAEAGTTAQLLINGNFAAGVFVAGMPRTDAAFVFRDVPLAAQGANMISVRALDSRAASPNSPSIQVILLLGAPQIPSDLSAESAASGAIALSWVTVSTDTRTASYRLYRSTDAALLPLGAAAPPASLVATNIRDSRYTDIPHTDGVYYYALTAVDLAGNQSGLSSPASAVSDRAAPTAEFRLTSAAARVGPGTYAAELKLSKVLAQAPLLTLAPFGASPFPLPLTAVTAILWRTTVTISAETPSGMAAFGFNGTDLVGNAGKTITQGSTLLVDARGPIGTVSFSKSSPVGPGPLGITLTLNEPAVSSPSLSIALMGGSILPISLVESSTDGRIWTGQVAITTATGDGSATLRYSAADSLGNISNLLTGITQLDIKTAPPGIPLALRATSLSGARVSLSWSAPVGDALAVFRVYRDGVFLSAVSPAADRSGAFIDTPTEGSYRYTVSAVDLAGNEGPTVAVIGRARATPPVPPVDLTASINSAGQILLAWHAGSTDTARFLVYRATSVIASLAGIAPRDSVSPLTDLPTQDANYHYVVTALDDAGNESAPSSETVIIFDRAGPTVDVSGVANGGLYNRTVFPSFTASSLILDAASVRATLDSQTFLSGSSVSAEGSHTLVVTAANTRGRVSTATVTFAIDKTPPSIVLSGILEGELLRSSGAISIAVTDANLGAVSFSLYNQVLGTTMTYRSGDLISRNGKYSLSGTAADLAGNSSTAALTFQLAAGPLLPANLSVLIQDGARLSWEQPEPGVVAYRAYRDGIRISGSFLNSLSFVDPAFSPGTAHVYEVSAVDAFGVEGPKARASVPAIDLSLSPVTLTRGFFEEARPALVNNSSADAFIGPADVELVDATGVLVSAKAPISGVGPGRTGNLTATLATPASLPAAVSMRVTAALQTDIGAWVAIRKSIAVSVVDPPLPLVEVLPEALVPGTLSSVRVRLYNRGSAAMDVITASVAGSVSNAVENVQVRLKSLDGSLLGAAGLNQTSGATAAVVAGRTVFFVRVPAGESFLFEPIRVVVPNTAAGNLLVEALVSTPTFNLPSTGLSGTRGYQAQAVGAVVQSIPYTATVVPDKSVYDQGEQVVLTGRALSPDGTAVSSAAVVVHITQGGFDRMLQAVTDLSGDYAVTFNPFTTEAGVYALASAHPDVVTRAIQSSFTIVGFGFNYRDFTATLAQNSSLPFTINLTNAGGAPLTGLTASTAAISVSGVTLTLDPSSLPGTLAAGQMATLRLTAAADPTAVGGEMTLKVGESHGYTRTLSIRAQVAAAEAIPSASPQLFQVGMLAGQSRLQAVTLTNHGFAPWRGVRLTQPTLDWVRIDGLLEIGDIPPGGNANFTLRIEPPLSLPTTEYAQNPLLEVQSSNAATVPINAAITVTSSKQGTLVFNVINADKPRGANGLGVPVPGAVATLKSLDIAGLSFKVTADANGIVQFANAPSGNYAWTLEADGFQSDAGTIVLEPGLTKMLEKILATATIKYSWSVTPTTIVDKYDMALSVGHRPGCCGKLKSVTSG